MHRIPGHSMSVEEQDQLIKMYNDLVDHCDRMFETVERTSVLLEAVSKLLGIEAPKP